MSKSEPKLLAGVGKVEEGLPWIPDESADIAVFSPPYFARDGATPELLRATGKLLARALKPGRRAFCVVGQVSEDFDRIYEMRRCILEGADLGLTPWQTIAWIKSWVPPGEETTQGHYNPVNSQQILYYGHELIFQFVKGSIEDAPGIDKLSIGVTYADKSNLKRGTRGKNGDVHDPGDTWFVPYETTGKTQKKGHRHAYPAVLVRRCIKLANLPEGATVLDPFIGGGTTASVARELGHSVIAADVDQGAISSLCEEWGVQPVSGDTPPRKGKKKKKRKTQAAEPVAQPKPTGKAARKKKLIKKKRATTTRPDVMDGFV